MDTFSFHRLCLRHNIYFFWLTDFTQLSHIQQIRGRQCLKLNTPDFEVAFHFNIARLCPSAKRVPQSLLRVIVFTIKEDGMQPAGNQNLTCANNTQSCRKPTIFTKIAGCFSLLCQTFRSETSGNARGKWNNTDFRSNLANQEK